MTIQYIKDTVEAFLSALGDFKLTVSTNEFCAGKTVVYSLQKKDKSPATK
jgi:hypothetical protein